MSQCTWRVRKDVVYRTCFSAMRKRVRFARRQVKGSIRTWLSPQCQELSCVARPARVREVGRMIGLAIPHRFLDVISARQRSPCQITLVSIITIELAISTSFWCNKCRMVGFTILFGLLRVDGGNRHLVLQLLHNANGIITQGVQRWRSSPDKIDQKMERSSFEVLFDAATAPERSHSRSCWWSALDT